jgi:hypothetical protein
MACNLARSHYLLLTAALPNLKDNNEFIIGFAMPAQGFWSIAAFTARELAFAR